MIKGRLENLSELQKTIFDHANLSVIKKSFLDFEKSEVKKHDNQFAAFQKIQAPKLVLHGQALVHQ